MGPLPPSRVAALAAVCPEMGRRYGHHKGDMSQGGHVPSLWPRRALCPAGEDATMKHGTSIERSGFMSEGEKIYLSKMTSCGG